MILPKNTLTLGAIILLMYFSSYSSSAQIHFQLEKKGATTYRVCAISDQSYSYPQNTIISAQITLKIKVNSKFQIGNLQSSFSVGNWKITPKVQNAAKAPQTEYISININHEGGKSPAIVANECIELFTFENIGEIGDKITLIDDKDPMVKGKLETNLNLGNQINIIGYKNGYENAYVDNLPDVVSNAVIPISLQKIYPNPGASKLLSIDWQLDPKETVEAVSLSISNSINGKKIKVIPIENAQTGQNSTTVDISDLPVGEYIIYLQGSSIQSNALHFLKN